jgi:hypothetical protein
MDKPTVGSISQLTTGGAPFKGPRNPNLKVAMRRLTPNQRDRADAAKMALDAVGLRIRESVEQTNHKIMDVLLCAPPPTDSMSTEEWQKRYYDWWVNTRMSAVDLIDPKVE